MIPGEHHNEDEIHLKAFPEQIFVVFFQVDKSRTTKEQFSSYGINSPSIISGTSSIREKLNSESLSEEIEEELECKDILIFLCFPSLHFFFYITCCDYDITEKPAVVISRALQVCCLSSDGT